MKRVAKPLRTVRSVAPKTEAPSEAHGKVRSNGAASPAPLEAQVEHALHQYFETLDGALPCDLHTLVIAQVERPLLRTVMGYVNGNQCQAAAVLGISRGTLRKKLRNHGIL